MSRPLSEADLYLVMLEAIEEGLNIDLQPFCERLQVDRRDLLNQVAIAVARDFLSNTRDFEFGDEVMNALINPIVDVSMHAEMPQPAFDIYQAFDVGEYLHTGDAQDVCPWEKHTRPGLENILRNHLPTLE